MFTLNCKFLVAHSVKYHSFFRNSLLTFSISVYFDSKVCNSLFCSSLLSLFIFYTLVFFEKRKKSFSKLLTSSVSRFSSFLETILSKLTTVLTCFSLRLVFPPLSVDCFFGTIFGPTNSRPSVFVLSSCFSCSSVFEEVPGLLFCGETFCVTFSWSLIKPVVFAV